MFGSGLSRTWTWYKIGEMRGLLTQAVPDRRSPSSPALAPFSNLRSLVPMVTGPGAEVYAEPCWVLGAPPSPRSLDS